MKEIAVSPIGDTVMVRIGNATLSTLVLNQYKAERRKYDTKFYAVVNRIDHVVVIMTSWDSPYNFTRSWYLWNNSE